MSTEHQGAPCGIGLVLEKRDARQPCIVLKLSEGGNALLSGEIDVGDELLAVDGLQCYGQELSTILNRIRGKHGTTLELKVKKVGGEGLIKLNREYILAFASSSKDNDVNLGEEAPRGFSLHDIISAVASRERGGDELRMEGEVERRDQAGLLSSVTRHALTSPDQVDMNQEKKGTQNLPSTYDEPRSLTQRATRNGGILKVSQEMEYLSERSQGKCNAAYEHAPPEHKPACSSDKDCDAKFTELDAPQDKPQPILLGDAIIGPDGPMCPHEVLQAFQAYQTQRQLPSQPPPRKFVQFQLAADQQYPSEPHKASGDWLGALVAPCTPHSSNNAELEHSLLSGTTANRNTDKGKASLAALGESVGAAVRQGIRSQVNKQLVHMPANFHD